MASRFTTENVLRMVFNDEDSYSDDEPCCDGSDEEFGLYEGCGLEEDDEERANGIEERNGREQDVGDEELNGEEMCVGGRELEVGENDEYDVRGEDSDDEEDRSITIVKGKGKHKDLE